MRAFVVLAVVALASADVKHLYDAPYNKPAAIGGSTGYNYGVGNNGAGSNLNNNVAQPSNYGQQGGFVQQQPIGTSNPGRFGGDSVGSLPLGSTPGLLSTGPIGNNGFSGPISSGNPGFSGPISSGNKGFSGPISSGSNGFSGPISSGNTGFSGPISSGNSGFSGPVGSGSGSNYGVNPFGPTGNYKATVVKQTVPLVSKSSYVYSAPDDSEDIQREQTIVLPRPRQHYKVVFIKAPSTTVINTPSTGTGGHAQEKTLIYVLSDKKRIENHIDVPDTDANKLQKPEVFFVKYNKPTEVVNSQIKYETVDAINGAENGAVNGVPNKVRGNGQLHDEPATPEQAQIANAIHQALQNGGLDSALNKVNELIKGGHSITAGNDLPNRGHYDQQLPSNIHATGAIPPTQGGSNNGVSYPEQGYVY